MASVGDHEAADNFFSETAFPLHTLAKCPFFWHLRQVASLTGHVERGCLLLSQKKRLEVSGSTAADVVISGSTSGELLTETAALVGTCATEYDSELRIADSKALA